jgi:hypothetical protein
MTELPRKTAHQMRCEQVRERVSRVVHRIPKEIRKGGFTKTGVFAERVWKIAVERELPISKSHKGAKTATGTPKDLVTQVNYFMTGKTGAYETRLDVYELACIEFETEWREQRQERRSQLTVVTDPPKAPEAVVIHQDALQAAKIQQARATFEHQATGYDPPDEFQAASTINGALSNFDTVTSKRILRYVEIALEARDNAYCHDLIEDNDQAMLLAHSVDVVFMKGWNAGYDDAERRYASGKDTPDA